MQAQAYMRIHPDAHQAGIHMQNTHLPSAC